MNPGRSVSQIVLQLLYLGLVLGGIIVFSIVRKQSEERGQPMFSFAGNGQTRDNGRPDDPSADGSVFENGVPDASVRNVKPNEVNANGRPANTSGVEPVRRLSLRDALDEGKIEVEVKGGGLSSVTVTIKLKSEEHLTVEISAGTVFNPGTSRLQNMMSVADIEIRLDKNGHRVEKEITVRCINMHRDAPESSDRLTVDPSASGDLQRLVTNDAFRKSGSNTQQFAVWTITDNPARGDYVGIGYFGFGLGPGDDDFSKIRELLVASDIDPERYRAFAPPPAKRVAQVRTAEPQTAKDSPQPAKGSAPMEKPQDGRKRYKIVSDQPQSGKRMIKVLFSSEDAHVLSEDDILTIAEGIATNRKSSIHFFLPGMDPSKLPWATANYDHKKPHVSVFRSRTPK